MERKDVYEALSKCRNCKHYNTIKCMTCGAIYQLNGSVEYAVNDFCKSYETENSIEAVTEKQDNYEFESVFDRVDGTEQNDILEAEIVD